MIGSLAAPAQAQEDGAVKRLGTTVTPRISVSETWTDNLALSADGARDRAFITSVAPGVSIVSQTGWLRGTLDYSLEGLYYTKSSQSGRVQQQLNAHGNAELVPNSLFVDATGNISQQSISAFGQTSPSNELASPNRTESRALMVSPYWRGTLSSFATFELRATGQIRDASEAGNSGSTVSSSSGDTKQGTLSFTMNGPQGRALNWGLQATTTRIHYDLTGLDNRSSLALGSLSWIPDVDWVLGINAGVEKSNFLGNDTSTIYGANAKWTPTARTTVSADWQRHSYGNSHNLIFEHRMKQFVLRATSTQAVSTYSDATGGLTNYQLLDLQYQSTFTDAAQRDAMVRAVLNAMGLSADAISSSGYLVNNASLQRRNEVSLAWTGQRLTLTLGANDNNSRVLQDVNAAGSTTTTGDYALTNTVRQRGVTTSVNYRLTAQTNGTLTYTRQRSLGDSTSGLSSSTTAYYATVTTRLGPQTDASAGLRHTTFDSSIGGGYRENAVFATLTRRF